MHFLTNSGQHLEIVLEPDPFINKPMDFREKTDKNTANSFVEKLAKTNEFFKKQMVFRSGFHMNITQSFINKTFPITF